MFSFPFSYIPFSSLDESATLTLRYDSAYALDSVRLSGVDAFVSSNTTPLYFFGPKHALDWTQDEEYTVSCRLVGIGSGSAAPIRVALYAVGPAFPSRDPLGTLLYETVADDTSQYVDIDPVRFNIVAPITGKAYLRFVVYSGVWNVSGLSVQSATEFGFNPASAITSTIIRNRRFENLQFKVDLYDANNNLFPVDLRSSVTYFDGGNLLIQGQDNYLGGTITVGDLSAGQGISLTSRGFTSSVGPQQDAPAIFIGAGQFNNVNTPFLVGSSSLGPVFSLGNKLSYNAATNTLSVSGNFEVLGGNSTPRPIVATGEIFTTVSTTESIIRVVATDPLNEIIPSIQVRGVSNVSSIQFISQSVTASFWRARRTNYREQSSVSFFAFSPIITKTRTIENLTVIIPPVSINSPRLVIYPKEFTDSAVTFNYESITGSAIQNRYYVISESVFNSVSSITGPFPITGVINSSLFSVNPVITNDNFVVSRSATNQFYIFESDYHVGINDSSKLTQTIIIAPPPTTTTTAGTTTTTTAGTTTTTTAGTTTTTTAGTTTTTTAGTTTTTTCPPDGTFLGCVGTTAIEADGSCGETYIPLDGRCAGTTTTTTAATTTTTTAATTTTTTSGTTTTTTSGTTTTTTAGTTTTTTAGTTTTTTTTTEAPTTTTTTTTTTTCTPAGTFLYCLGTTAVIANGDCNNNFCPNNYLCGGSELECFT